LRANNSAQHLPHLCACLPALTARLVGRQAGGVSAGICAIGLGVASCGKRSPARRSASRPGAPSDWAARAAGAEALGWHVTRFLTLDTVRHGAVGS